jgi:acetolactate synthase, large subunit, biosynthetic type
MKLNGSEILMESLLAEGVSTVFGYPGGAVLNIYDALYKYADKITHVETSHEQGASHAADGYARASGKVGVCIATSGPGATNTVTGIANAYMDSIPIVVITGNVSSNLLGLDSFQEVDIAGITMPITKHNFIVNNVEKLGEIVRRAFDIARSGRPGPVLIDIPKDISAAVCEYENTPAKTSKADVVFPPSEAFAKAVEAIKSSKKPFIYSGGGVISAGASTELAKLAELLNAPVSASLMGKGSFPCDSPKYVGMLGMHGTALSAEILKNCDLFIGVGTRFSDRVVTSANTFGVDAKIIHIDIDKAEIGKNLAASTFLLGDAKAILTKLIAELKPQKSSEWQQQIDRWRSDLPTVPAFAADENAPVTPEYIFSVLNEKMQADDVLTTEVGQHQMWAAQYYNARKPRSFISSGGLGTMGFGLGAAIGASCAKLDMKQQSNVVNIAGDGCFHMNMSELATVSKLGLPIVEIVFRNGVLGMVRQWQKLFYENRFSQTTLENKTDIAKIAEAFGITAHRAATCGEFKKSIEAAFAANSPAVIDCAMDKDINVLPMVPAGGDIRKPILKI